MLAIGETPPDPQRRQPRPCAERIEPLLSCGLIIESNLNEGTVRTQQVIEGDGGTGKAKAHPPSRLQLPQPGNHVLELGEYGMRGGLKLFRS